MTLVHYEGLWMTGAHLTSYEFVCHLEPARLDILFTRTHPILNQSPNLSDPATHGRPKIFNAHLVAPIRPKRYRLRTEKYLTERLPNY